MNIIVRIVNSRQFVEQIRATCRITQA